MEAHLKLRSANLLCTHWLAAALLLKDAAKAVEAANELARHLDTIAHHARTKFETCMAEDRTLMAQLHTFVQTAPAIVIWKGGGRFAHLLQFLAARFLANPDSVVDIE